MRSWQVLDVYSKMLRGPAQRNINTQCLKSEKNYKTLSLNK